jgi:uncharacterized protein (TIGR03437 family)
MTVGGHPRTTGDFKPSSGMRRATLLGLAIILLSGIAPAQSGDLPAGFEPIDAAFRAFLETYSLPGAAIAIAKEGRLVLAKGYGLADVEQGQAVQPDSRFRFGSIGKTITAIAVMKLVQGGKLSLDSRAFDILSDIRPRSGRLGDSRISAITIRNLLTHSGGWDAAKSGEPIAAPFSQQIASAMGVPFPPPPTAIISYILDRRLDFDPGAQFAYCNFGFLILGRVIEKITGQPYEEFVGLQVLTPLGIERMRQGRTPLSLRMPGEVRYYDYPGAPLVDSLMPGVSGKVTEPYSGMVAMESIDSAGGWIASPIDLVRIFTMLDGWGAPAVLTPESVQQMITPVFTIPGVGADAGKPLSVGLGIGVESTGPDALWAHGGGTFGTLSFACRMGHGWAWAVIFNSATRDSLYSSNGAPEFDSVLKQIFTKDAFESVAWPEGDLFPQYLPSGRPTISQGGVVNAASGQSATIAPGELVTIFGSFLGPRDGVSVSVPADGTFPSKYSGTQVLVSGIAAPLIFVSDSQINAVTPFGIDSSAPVQVSARAFGYESEPLMLPGAAAAPALFTTGGSGMGQAAALNADSTPNSAANPARAGSIVTLYGTGFGRTEPVSVDGLPAGPIPANLAVPVHVSVAGQDALVSYAGSAPGLVAGVVQINVRIPEGVASGPAAVAVSAGNFSSAATATIAIH